MNLWRIFRTWKQRSRKLGYWIGPMKLPILLVWMLIAALVRAIAPGETEAPKPKRRENPPGWTKARILAFERNRRLNNNILHCEHSGQAETQCVQSWPAHHIKSFKRWPELRLAPENIAVWCNICNLRASDRYATRDLQRCPRKMAD